MEHEHPESLTARAVKKALPERAILTKDARRTLNSAASVFTLYLASIAHETSVANKRSTITLKDVLQTLRDVDFEHFIEPIEASLQEAKATAGLKKSRKVAAEEEEGAATTTEVEERLDEVAIDTNEEEEGDENMVGELSDQENDGVEDDTQDEGKFEQESDSRERKTEENDSDEAMDDTTS